MQKNLLPQNDVCTAAEAQLPGFFRALQKGLIKFRLDENENYSYLDQQSIPLYKIVRHLPRFFRIVDLRRCHRRLSC